MSNSSLVNRLQTELRHESHSRQLQEDVNTKLQSEYDDLLRRLAEAENHIDRLRLGANLEMNKHFVITHEHQYRDEDHPDGGTRTVPHNAAHTQAVRPTTANENPGSVHEDTQDNDVEPEDTLVTLDERMAQDLTLKSPSQEHYTFNAHTDPNTSHINHAFTAHPLHDNTPSMSDDNSLSQMSAITILDRANAESIQYAHLLKIKSLQGRIEELKSKLNKGKSPFDEVLASLQEIQKEHGQLSEEIDDSQEYLDSLKDKYEGRASNRIASSQRAVEKELATLANQLKDLVQLLQLKAGDPHILTPPLLHSLTPPLQHTPHKTTITHRTPSPLPGSATIENAPHTNISRQLSMEQSTSDSVVGSELSYDSSSYLNSKYLNNVSSATDHDLMSLEHHESSSHDLAVESYKLSHDQSHDQVSPAKSDCEYLSPPKQVGHQVNPTESQFNKPPFAHTDSTHPSNQTKELQPEQMKHQINPAESKSNEWLFVQNSCTKSTNQIAGNPTSYLSHHQTHSVPTQNAGSGEVVPAGPSSLVSHTPRIWKIPQAKPSSQNTLREELPYQDPLRDFKSQEKSNESVTQAPNPTPSHPSQRRVTTPSQRRITTPHTTPGTPSHLLPSDQHPSHTHFQSSVTPTTTTVYNPATRKSNLPRPTTRSTPTCSAQSGYHIPSYLPVNTPSHPPPSTPSYTQRSDLSYPHTITPSYYSTGEQATADGQSDQQSVRPAGLKEGLVKSSVFSESVRSRSPTEKRDFTTLTVSAIDELKKELNQLKEQIKRSQSPHLHKNHTTHYLHRSSDHSSTPSSWDNYAREYDSHTPHTSTPTPTHGYMISSNNSQTHNTSTAPTLKSASQASHPHKTSPIYTSSILPSKTSVTPSLPHTHSSQRRKVHTEKITSIEFSSPEHLSTRSLLHTPSRTVSIASTPQTTPHHRMGVETQQDAHIQREVNSHRATPSGTLSTNSNHFRASTSPQANKFRSTDTLTIDHRFGTPAHSQEFSPNHLAINSTHLPQRDTPHRKYSSHNLVAEKKSSIAPEFTANPLPIDISPFRSHSKVERSSGFLRSSSFEHQTRSSVGLEDDWSCPQCGGKAISTFSVSPEGTHTYTRSHKCTQVYKSPNHQNSNSQTQFNDDKTRNTQSGNQYKCQGAHQSSPSHTYPRDRHKQQRNTEQLYSYPTKRDQGTQIYASDTHYPTTSNLVSRPSQTVSPPDHTKEIHHRTYDGGEEPSFAQVPTSTPVRARKSYRESSQELPVHRHVSPAHLDYKHSLSPTAHTGVRRHPSEEEQSNHNRQSPANPSNHDTAFKHTSSYSTVPAMADRHSTQGIQSYTAVRPIPLDHTTVTPAAHTPQGNRSRTSDPLYTVRRDFHTSVNTHYPTPLRSDYRPTHAQQNTFYMYHNGSRPPTVRPGTPSTGERIVYVASRSPSDEEVYLLEPPATGVQRRKVKSQKVYVRPMHKEVYVMTRGSGSDSDEVLDNHDLDLSEALQLARNLKRRSKKMQGSLKELTKLHRL